MAEGGVDFKEKEQVATSGSEFVYDFYCEICRDDGLNVEAKGYCKNCQEYVCDICKRAHTKTRATRNHLLLDEESMPKDTPLSQDRVSKDISTHCGSHSGETVKFHCRSHDVLGCSMCFVEDHRYCTDVVSIYKESENILTSKEYSDFIQKLNAMEQKTHDIIAKVSANVTALQQSCSETKRQIRKLREEFIAMFDELERSLITEAETLSTEDKAEMDRLENEMKKFSIAVENLKSEVDELVKSKRVCQLYIQMNEKKGELSSLEKNLREADERSHVRTFEFEPNDIKELIKANGIGKVSVHSHQNVRMDTPTDEMYRDKTAIHVCDIDISVGSDATNSYYLVGSAIMSDTRMLVVDHSHHKVKLLNTRTKTVLGEISAIFCPFDIAKINKNQAAVSLFSDKILLLKVTDDLSVDKEISVSDECRGVAYCQGKLLVTFESDPRLEIIDLQGNVIKVINKNTDGNKLFSHPRHICVSKNGENIYVSDNNKSKVFCMTLDGAVKSEYSELNEPQKVCTDQHGYIYVAGDDSKTVHMMTPDCTKIKEVLTQADGLDKRVMSVSYCQDNNQLYVGMDGSKFIKVYQL